MYLKVQCSKVLLLTIAATMDPGVSKFWKSSPQQSGHKSISADPLGYQTKGCGGGGVSVVVGQRGG